MHDIVRVSPEAASLPALIDRAARTLAEAKTSAEVLDARDLAASAYDAAKRAARLSRAKAAYDDMMPRIHRAQADALLIEAAAKRRLADEYDAAQERREIATPGNPNFSGREKLASGSDLVPPKELHEARRIREAEKIDPGIVARTLNAAVAAGEEPTRTKVRRAVHEIARDRKGAGLADAGRNPERIAKQRLDARLWADLKEAITKLSGLPRPVDVAAVIKGFGKAEIVDEHMPNAVHWLKEFSDVWRDRDQADAA